MRISQSRGDDDDNDKSAAGREGLGSMLVPKSYSWKAARAKLPPSRQMWLTLRSPRTWALCGVVVVLVLLWRSMGSAAEEMQRYGDTRADSAPTWLTRNQVLLLGAREVAHAYDGKRNRGVV